MSKPHVVDTEFVVAWQHNKGSVIDVARQFELNPVSVRARAKRMIDAGIPLMPIVNRPRGRKRTQADIDMLANLINNGENNG